jgi:hypothetical protein
MLINNVEQRPGVLYKVGPGIAIEDDVSFCALS